MAEAKKSKLGMQWYISTTVYMLYIFLSRVHGNWYDLDIFKANHSD